MTHEISIVVARRFLAIRHLLAPPRALPAEPESVMAVVDRLGSLQFDPLEVAGRNHDLVLQARIGGYRRELADELLYGRRLLFEAYNKALNLLPTRELPYYRITWDRGALGWEAQLIAEQQPLTDKLLAAIEAEGPKSSADFEREPAIAWHWGPTMAVRAVLEALAITGRLGLARRQGNRRFYDLTERLYPADLLATRVPEREQLLHKLLSRYRGHGLLGATGSSELWAGTDSAVVRTELRAELLDRGEILQVTVEGVRGPRFIIGDELPLLAQAERECAPSAAVDAGPALDFATWSSEGASGCSFLAPLDPLIWDRNFLDPLYGFEYRWEVYTPAAKRRWGYYVLPIMFGDRLVGRVEPRIDRTSKVVRILGMSWEASFDPLDTPGFVSAFAAALNSYQYFAEAAAVIAPLDAAHGPLFRALDGQVKLLGEDPVRPSIGGVRVSSGKAAATS